MPWPTGLVVKKGSKILLWISLDMPVPVSATSMRHIVARRHDGGAQRRGAGHRLDWRCGW